MQLEDTKIHKNLEEHIIIAIRDIGIPPRPTVLSEIESEMAKDEPDFTHLAKIISADVALSAGLLKTVNSPYYGLDKKVRRSCHAKALRVFTGNSTTRMRLATSCLTSLMTIRSCVCRSHWLASSRRPNDFGIVCSRARRVAHPLFL